MLKVSIAVAVQITSLYGLLFVHPYFAVNLLWQLPAIKPTRMTSIFSAEDLMIFIASSEM